MGLEEDMADLRAIDADDADGERRLVSALKRKSGLLVGIAADQLGQAGKRGCEADMVKAFATLSERGVQRDPGCRGKYALIRALDAMDWHDDEVFRAGVRLRQMEPSWGPPVDTAGAVRSQSAFGLVRLATPDTPLVLADLLVDPLPNVRANAARGFSAWADRMGAAVLRLKLHTGDDDPVVLCETLASLIELDAESGLDFARQWLVDDDSDNREVAALALGQTRLAEALPLLLGALRHTVDAEERRTLLVSVGTLRIEPARDALIERLDGRDIEPVLEALAPFRFDPTTLKVALQRTPSGIHDQLREALEPG